MRCRNIHKLLPEFCSNGLSTKQASEVSRHLGDCADCRQQEARYRQLFSRLSLSNETPDASVDWAAFGVRLNERLDGQKSGYSWSPRPAFAIAAAAVIVITMLGVLFSGILRDSRSPDEVMYSELEQELAPKILQDVPYEAIDEIVVVSGGSDAEIGLSDFDSRNLTETASTEIDDLLLATLNGDVLLEDNLDYLSHEEAFGLLSEAESERLLKTLETQTFTQN